MKVVALISGGKDSCFNMMHCIANEEIDSYMYQTVGHDVIQLYEEIMNIPLYQEYIMGTSIDQSLTYHETPNDETEDLYRLLKKVQNLHPEIEAVSVGTILSNYQRIRVENKSKGFIRRNDISKFTCYHNKGLNKSHLGKSLVQIKDHLLEMNERYNLHICGEGGEYESLVLDCPIFRKRIKIIKSEIINHSPADVSYLRFIAETEEKLFNDIEWKERFILPDELDEKYKQLKKCIDESYTDRKYNETYLIPIISIKENNNDKILTNSSKLENLIAIGAINANLDFTTLITCTLEEEFHCCMNNLKVFISGQSGIIPSTMCLPYPKSFSSEVIISLQNLEKIFESMEIFSVSCIAFISDKCHVFQTNNAWKHSFLHNENRLIILVNSLSSGALIEWQVTGKKKGENIYYKMIKNNSWSILHSTFKINENSELSLEVLLETLLNFFKKNSTNKILSSTIYYDKNSFEKINSLEIISKIILNTVKMILGYTIDAHCISSDGIWISGEIATPVLMAMKIIYL
ncbi:hypothetical protein PCANB_002271 [Pneumocystis canis]|nr:hypothetical protein PCANB_002271 [Pneumocystis canis]